MEKRNVIELLESLKSLLEEKSFSSLEYVSIFSHESYQDEEWIVTMEDVSLVIDDLIEKVRDADG